MISTTRQWSDSPSLVEMIYYLMRNGRESCTDAHDTVERMQLVSVPQTSAMLQYVVVVQAESNEHNESLNNVKH